MELTLLELDVLTWIARNSGDPALKAQLSVVEVVEREYTGVGSFTELRVLKTLPRVNYRVCPVHPLIDSRELQHGGGSVLFFEDGLACTLELYAYAGDFPQDLRTWSLRAGAEDINTPG